jgi:virginiamycin B lyase
MKKSLLPLLIALTLAIFLAGSWSNQSSAAPPAGILFTEYPIPTPNSQPRNLLALAPGDIWFTMPGASAIGHLVVSSTGNHVFTIYPTPTPNSQPYDLAHFNGTIWFTEYAGNRLGALNISTGIITEYALPTANSGPTGIDVSGTGEVWAVTKNANSLIKKPLAGGITEYTDSRLTGGQLADVMVGNNDSIWFSAPGINQAFNFAPLSGNLLIPLYPTPDPEGTPAVPDQLDLDGGAPWLTDSANSRIGRYAPGTLTLWRWYRVSDEPVGLTGMHFRQLIDAKQVWFNEADTNRVGQMTIDSVTGVREQFWRQPLPQPDSDPQGITVDANGTAWITLANQNKILSWNAPYYDFPSNMYLPTSLKK